MCPPSSVRVGSTPVLHSGLDFVVRAWAQRGSRKGQVFSMNENQERILLFGRRCRLHKHAYYRTIDVLLSIILPIFTREGEIAGCVTFVDR